MGSIAPEELHAFIDGELPPERVLQVEAELARDPELAEEMALHLRDLRLLAKVYDPVLDWPWPARSPRPHGLWTAVPPWAYAATGLAAAAVAVAGVLTLWQPGSGDPFIAEAVAVWKGEATIERRVDAAPAERDRIVAATVEAPVQVPELMKAGFRLESVAIYTDARRHRFAALRYAGSGGRVFSVALEHGKGGSSFALTKRAGLEVCVWRTDDLEAVMVGNMTEGDMLRIAGLTYGALNF